MFMKKLGCGVSLAAIALVSATAVHAQETTSAVRGVIVTSDGQPISAATITVVHGPSSTTTRLVTGADGVFDARGLRVGGPYSITIDADGYATESLNDLFLQVGGTMRLNIDLESLSSVDDIIVVGARDVTRDNSGVSSILDREGVESVVSVNRDIRDLARRNMLVSQNTRGDGGISIAGSNPRQNRVSIDGIAAQDDYGLNTGGLPTRRGPISLDAIEQFSVSAVPVDVENGDFSGGAMDVVLRSGGNSFHGAAFLNYLNDGMVGDTLRGAKIPTQVSQENWGLFFSGPIWRDRLFFAVSYETYETYDATATGPTGAGFSNSIRGITQADLDSFVNLFNTTYATDFEIGAIARTKPITDEKTSVKLDWNINDNHRLSLTYRNAESSLFSRTNIGTTSAGFDSQWYLVGESDTGYAAELNSQWTNTFNTQLRINYREYERLQQPPSGQEFADITVCSDATRTVTSGNITGCGSNSVFRFGPDQFRHANYLATENLQIQAKGEWSLGDHLFKFGYQSQDVSLYNLFVPNSNGTYYFDSLEDFRTGQASRLIYNNAVSGNKADGAADMGYQIHSLFAQDTFQITSDLTLQAGVRVDMYKSDSVPAYNANFVARNGFSNQETVDGMQIVMPRASFEWRANDWFELRGGLGLFSGGLPDVVLANSFGTTGVLTNQIQIERNADGTFRETTGAPGFTQAIGATALNINLADPRFGYSIPASVQTLQGGAIVSPASEVNALAPGFKMPSDWKYFLTASFSAPEGWASSFLPDFGARAVDNWRVNVDVVYTQVNDGVSFRDFRAKPLIVNGAQALTPDGRLRYDGLGGNAAQRAGFGVTSTNPGSNRDIVAVNTDRGQAFTASISANRRFGNGLDLLVGYARSNVEDAGSGLRFASTASSQYGAGATNYDPNEDAYGTNYEQVTNRFKLEASYSREFFSGLETRLNFFGEVRDGRPINFVMNDPNSRSPTFGVNRGGHLLYVPDFANDPNPNDLNVGFVTFDSATTRDRFRQLVDYFDLPYGQIVEKGYHSDKQPEIYQIDLQFSQQLPVPFLPGRFRFVADIQNFANLLNDEWGIVEEHSDTLTIINAQCANNAGVVPGAGDPTCSRYRYSSASSSADVLNRDQNGRSFWTIQVGLRYEF